MLHQLFFTHCTTETSAWNQWGYDIRATSLPRERFKQLVWEIEGLMEYHLAPDVPPREWTTLTAATTPPRYLFVSTSFWKTVAARISFRPFDSAGLPCSYFAHVLLSEEQDPDLTARGFLQLWDAPGWVTEDSAAIPHQLPTIERADALFDGRTPVIGDALLADFLTSDSVSQDAFIPERWRLRTPAERRRLLVTAVAAFLDPSWSQVCFVSESSFAAVLMYGVLRLAEFVSDVQMTPLSTLEFGARQRFPRMFVISHSVAQRTSATSFRNPVAIIDTYAESCSHPEPVKDVEDLLEKVMANLR